MKSMVSKVAAVVMLAATTGVGARAQFSTACTDATLKGDYSVTISGQIFLPGGVVVQRLGINITHFDGAGHLSQEDLVLSSPNAPAPLGVPPKNASGFQIDETGTYTVNPDLTTSTGGSVKGAVISAHFTISDSGRAVHILVTSLTPPGAPGPVPALISSEGRKIGPIEQD